MARSNTDPEMISISVVARAGRASLALLCASFLLAACAPADEPTALPPPSAVTALPADTPIMEPLVTATKTETLPTTSPATATTSTSGTPAASPSAPLTPEGTAQAVFDAWQHRDLAAAEQLGEQAAVTELFSRLWRPTDGWLPDGCEGAAGSTYCTWHTSAGRLVLRVRNPGAGMPMVVTEARFEVAGGAASPTATPIATVAATVASHPTATPQPPAPTVVADPGVLRRVNWRQVLAGDPKLILDTSVPDVPGLEGRPFIQVRTWSDPAGGYAMIGAGEVLYHDFSGDGVEEAVISLASGGTAGNTGLLVYRAAGTKPVLAEALPGYKLGAVAGGRFLKVTEPIYSGWEPNCCPSGFFETLYRLDVGQLTQAARTEHPYPEAKLATVNHFYDLLTQRNFQDAYNGFLSANFKTNNPYAQWEGGYQNTESFSVETTMLPDGSVHVALTSVDKTPTGSVTHHFDGTWTLTWFSTARTKQWVLDKASFKAVK